MEHLISIIRKELIELLRDQRLILGLVMTILIFPLMGTFISGVFRETVTTSATIGVVDNDRGEYARSLIEALKANATVIAVSSLEEGANANVDIIVVIPEGFSANLTESKQGFVEVYAVLKGVSMSASIRPTRALSLVQDAARRLAVKIAASLGVNPKLMTEPFYSRTKTIYKGKIVNVHPAVLTGFLAGQLATTPIAVFILVMFTAQLAVTSMALEKENKTLELLLSQPVNRMTILAGKLVASLVLAIISSVVFLVGFTLYMSQITSMTPETANISLDQLSLLGLLPTPLSATLMIIDILLGLLAVMSLALIIGAATEDVRSAQSLLSLVLPLILIPALGLMFVDIETMPPAVAIVVMIDPFAHPVLAVSAAFTNNYRLLLLSVAYLLGFSIVTLYIASKLFASERILTLRLRWKRVREAY